MSDTKIPLLTAVLAQLKEQSEPDELLIKKLELWIDELAYNFKLDPKYGVHFDIHTPSFDTLTMTVDGAGVTFRGDQVNQFFDAVSDASSDFYSSTEDMRDRDLRLEEAEGRFAGNY